MVSTYIFSINVAGQHYVMITTNKLDLPKVYVYNQINNSTRELLCVKALAASYKN